MGVTESVSPEVLAAALKSQGLTDEQIEATMATYAEAKYAPKRVDLKPVFFIESDQVVQIGKKEIKLRYMNPDDMKRMGPKVVQLAKALILENDLDFESGESLLDSKGAMGFLELVLGAMNDLGKGEGYPEWAAAIYEEIAHLCSNDEVKVTAGEIVSLPFSHLYKVIQGIVKVNQADFFILWGQVPQSLRSKITILVLESMNAVKSFGMTMAQNMSAGGTPLTTGKSITSSPSKKPKASARKKSKAKA